MALPAAGEGQSSALGIAMILAALVSYGFRVRDVNSPFRS